MLESIYLDPRIHKGLDSLRRAGKKASQAADKVEEIIARLQSGGVIPNKLGTVTKHGDLRIKGLMKYDLGSGYRLITFKQGSLLFLLYVGTHDDCYRWIENNRELRVDQVRTRCERLPIYDGTDFAENGKEDRCEFEEKEHDPLSELSQKDLREVFRGLVGG